MERIKMHSKNWLFIVYTLLLIVILPSIYGQVWWNSTSDLNSGLVAYYSMNYNTSGVGDDVAGLHNLSTDAPVFTNSGKLNGSYYFDGSNDFMFLHGTQMIGMPNGTADRTISYWINHTAIDYNAFSVGFGSDSGTNYCYKEFFAGIVAASKKFQFWGYCSDSDATTITGSTNMWYHYVITSENKYVRVWLNGTQIITFNFTDMNSGGNLFIGDQAGVGTNAYHKGYIDEIAIWNRTLNASAVADLYNSGTGLYYQPNDPNPQFANFTSSSQVPPNLNLSNIIGNLVNITYNFSNINPLSVKLNYKSNSTQSNFLLFRNGTKKTTDYKTTTCINTSGTSAICNLDDNDILPTSTNIDADVFENTIHTNQILANQNTWVKIRFYNVSSTEQYGFYENMVNTSGIDPITTYYCNSSYSTGSPLTSVNCCLLATTPAAEDYNHVHNLSKHKVISFAVYNGLVNGVKVTPTSYFLTRGSNTQSNIIWGISQSTRIDQERITTNGGTSWSNLEFTPDSHIHQISNDTFFHYYASGNSTLSDSLFNSSITSDLLALLDLPPNALNFKPITTKLLQNSLMLLNWTASSSPLNLTINYSISLEDSLQAPIRNLIETDLLNYTYNASDPVGFYAFHGHAYDTLGLSSRGTTSGLFEICIQNLTCMAYDVCTINNNSICLNVTDVNNCFGIEINFSSYNTSCVYVYPTIPPTNLFNFSLADTNSVFIFGILIFFWLGLALLTFTFRNFAFGSMMWFVGLILGIISLQFSFVLSVLFLMMSTIIFMKVSHFK